MAKKSAGRFPQRTIHKTVGHKFDQFFALDNEYNTNDSNIYV